MRVPQWFTLAVAGFVIVFGLYRLWLASRPRAEQERAMQRRGLFGRARSTQILVGIVYLILGGMLIATSFGWNPIAGAFAPAAKTDKTVPADPGSIRLEK